MERRTGVAVSNSIYFIVQLKFTCLFVDRSDAGSFWLGLFGSGCGLPRHRAISLP